MSRVFPTRYAAARASLSGGYARVVTLPAGYRGQRLGLPPEGTGSLASTGSRLVGFVIDAVLSALVAGLFTAPHLPGNVSLIVFAAEYILFGAFFGQTPGMRVVGVRLVRVDGADGPARIGLPRAVVRTVMLMLIVPAIITDADGRGVHDRLAGTAVVRS
jgi:uncharacterized RDD family membrane protein YckC